jgi:hypothetical protein
MLKCVFPSYIGYKDKSSKVPVVLFVRFYVAPPSTVEISAAKLKAENIPAAESHELCEYFLSFMEMLHGVLINSYRQIVKVDMEKFYSDNPRTVMNFMRYENYVELSNYHTLHAETKSECTDGQARSLQPECERDVAVEKLYSK